jgi:hypothetical protein
MRNPARRLGRGQPPLMRQFWLHRSLRQRQEAGPEEGATSNESELTESGEAAPDDQT